MKCTFKWRDQEGNEQCANCEDLVTFVGMDCISVIVENPTHEMYVPSGCVDEKPTPLTGVSSKLCCECDYIGGRCCCENLKTILPARNVIQKNPRICRIYIDGKKLLEKL